MTSCERCTQRRSTATSLQTVRRCIEAPHTHLFTCTQPLLPPAGWFGDLVWSPCERLLAYVAEAKAPDTASFFDLPKPGASPPAPTTRKASPFDWEAVSRENSWGEKYADVRLPRLFVVSLAEGAVVAVPGIDPHISAGQPCWLPVPDGTGLDGSASGDSSREYVLSYVGWRDDTPRRLGMIYCFQRPCRLYGVRFPFPAPAAGVAATAAPAEAADAVPPPRHVCLTPLETIVRSPRLSPPLGRTVAAASAGARLLAFLSGEGSSLVTHGGAATLRALVLDAAWWAAVAGAFRSTDAPLPAPVTVVPATQAPVALAAASGSGNRLDYPGLYAHALPGRCWAADASALWLTSTCRSRCVVLRVDVGAALAAAVESVSGVASAAERVARAVSVEVDGSSASERRRGAYTATLFDALPLTGGGGVALLVGSADPISPERLAILVVPGAASGSRAWIPLGDPASEPQLSLPPWAATAADPQPPVAGELSGSPLSAGRAALAGLRWQLVRVQPLLLPGETAPAGSPPDFEALLLWSVAAAAAAAPTGGLPLVAFPHGGPHGAFSGDFLHAPAFLARCGFGVALVNYRGSTGFGAAAEASLPGRCGRQDVLDVHAAVLTLLALGGCGGAAEAALPPPALEPPVRCEGDVEYAPGEWAAAVQASLRWGAAAQAPLSADGLRLDAGRVVVTGGSHGGFLTAHLVGQFPGLYRAAVARNPVTNIAGEGVTGKGALRFGHRVHSPSPGPIPHHYLVSPLSQPWSRRPTSPTGAGLRRAASTRARGASPPRPAAHISLHSTACGGRPPSAT